jgi:hypothetical protein
MALPSQDYELCRKMIPEKIQAEEPFVSLNALVACMTHAKFKEFWTQYATMKDSLDAGASSLPFPLSHGVSCVVCMDAIHTARGSQARVPPVARRPTEPTPAKPPIQYAKRTTPLQCGLVACG